MVNYISLLVFIVLAVIGLVPTILVGGADTGLGVVFAIVWFIGSMLVASAIKLAAQWERAVVFRLGKFSSIKGPGLFLIIPIFDQLRKIDTRVLTMDIPRQQVITKDNVPISVNGVLFYRVTDPARAVIEVQNFNFAISQYAQTALRDVIGQMTLDEVLIEREQIGEAIEKIVAHATGGWGLTVDGIRIQDIDMPEELKKMMSRQASAEREKRANITKSEGDKLAAMNLADAARTMTASPGAMQLRTLQTLDGLGPTASNTVVMAVPVELLQLVQVASSALAKTEGEPKKPQS